MDELILRSLNGETTPDEDRELRDWRGASEANETRYQQLYRLAEMTRLVALSTRRSRPPEADELLRRLDDRLIADASGRARRLRSWTLWGAAASVAALMVFTIRQSPPESNHDSLLGVVELVTGANETVTATLGDGSIVRLAPETRLRTTGSRGERAVWLRGRAYFAVAKQENRPFRVRTDAGEATVLGTRFDMQARDGDLQLIVVQGRVEVAAAGTRVSIGPNEMSRVIDGGPPQVDHVDDVHRIVDWMDRFFVFESTPLREAAAELGRRYGLRVELRDSALGERLVSGWSANQSVEQTVTAICRTVGARCAIESGVIVAGP